MLGISPNTLVSTTPPRVLASGTCWTHFGVNKVILLLVCTKQMVNCVIRQCRVIGHNVDPRCGAVSRCPLTKLASDSLLHSVASLRLVSPGSGVARICCEEGQRLKLGHGALKADFRARCSSCLMINTNAWIVGSRISVN